MKTLRGIELRYVLTMFLFNGGPATIAELVAALRSQGFEVKGRASKAVSDALRWETTHGRVHRLGRGRYGPAWMPRSTEYRIHQRVLSLREDAWQVSLKGGHEGNSPGARREWPV